MSDQHFPDYSGGYGSPDLPDTRVMTARQGELILGDDTPNTVMNAAQRQARSQGFFGGMVMKAHIARGETALVEVAIDTAIRMAEHLADSQVAAAKEHAETQRVRAAEQGKLDRFQIVNEKLLEAGEKLARLIAEIRSSNTEDWFKESTEQAVIARFRREYSV